MVSCSSCLDGRTSFSYVPDESSYDSPDQQGVQHFLSRLHEAQNDDGGSTLYLQSIIVKERPTKHVLKKDATLRELIQEGLSLCSKVVLDENFWKLIHLRIQSHPSEVTSRDFQSMLTFFHVPHQSIPHFIIRDFFETKRIVRWWSTFRHVATSHWTTPATMRILLDAADDQQEMVHFCARLFSLLEEYDSAVPPSLNVIREILSSPLIGLQVLQEMVFDDGKVAMHYACSNEGNVEYVRLISKLAKDIDDTLDPCNCYMGGLVKYDCTDETPLKRIVMMWKDNLAADMIAELFVLYERLAEKLPNDLLHDAISREKWEVCKLLVHKAPRLLMVNNRVHGTPLNALIQYGHVSNLSLALFMVEQGLRVSNDDSILKDTCGLLLLSKHSTIVSPLQLLSVMDDTKAKQLLNQVIVYLVMEMEALTSKSAKNTHNCIVRLLKEMVRMQWWEYLEEFVEKYPQLLCIKDSDDNLLLHHVCKSEETHMDLIRIVIESGIKYNVGGKKGRGGLVVPNSKNEYPLQLICTRNNKSNNQLLKYLIERKPKLVLKRDFKNLNLLHSVANGGKVNVAKQILKACPESISFIDQNGRLPIHIACLHSCSVPQSQMLRLLLKEGMKQNLEGKGGLLLADDIGKSALDYAIEKLPCDERRWSSVNVFAEGIVPDLPLIQAAIHDGAPQWKIFSLLLKFPNCATIKDEDGCLPLHVFLEKDGALPNYVYEKITSSNTAAVKELSGYSGLYPFQAAATLHLWHVNFVYRLLRLDPSVLECCMNHEYTAEH